MGKLSGTCFFLVNLFLHLGPVGMFPKFLLGGLSAENAARHLSERQIVLFTLFSASRHVSQSLESPLLSFFWSPMPFVSKLWSHWPFWTSPSWKNAWRRLPVKLLRCLGSVYNPCSDHSFPFLWHSHAQWQVEQPD